VQSAEIAMKLKVVVTAAHAKESTKESGTRLQKVDLESLGK